MRILKHDPAVPPFHSSATLLMRDSSDGCMGERKAKTYRTGTSSTRVPGHDSTLELYSTTVFVTHQGDARTTRPRRLRASPPTDPAARGSLQRGRTWLAATSPGSRDPR